MHAIHFLVIGPRHAGHGRCRYRRVAWLPDSLASKVLFMSGYSDDALIRREGVLAGTTFLRKPFTSEALCGKVREVLDQPAPR